MASEFVNVVEARLSRIECYGSSTEQDNAALQDKSSPASFVSLVSSLFSLHFVLQNGEIVDACGKGN